MSYTKIRLSLYLKLANFEREPLRGLTKAQRAGQALSKPSAVSVLALRMFPIKLVIAQCTVAHFMPTDHSKSLDALSKLWSFLHALFKLF